MPVLLLTVTAVTAVFLVASQSTPRNATPIPPEPDRKVISDERPTEIQLRNKSKIIYATIYTYQADASQTDSTPCTTAAGIDACDPPYPIVANNGLPFFTQVNIRGVVYIVADRMNKRYGANVFDILTYESNYKLINEPVIIYE